MWKERERGKNCRHCKQLFTLSSAKAKFSQSSVRTQRPLLSYHSQSHVGRQQSLLSYHSSQAMPPSALPAWKHSSCRCSVSGFPSHMIVIWCRGRRCFHDGVHRNGRRGKKQTEEGAENQQDKGLRIERGWKERKEEWPSQTSDNVWREYFLMEIIDLGG